MESSSVHPIVQAIADGNGELIDMREMSIIWKVVTNPSLKKKISKWNKDQSFQKQLIYPSYVVKIIQYYQTKEYEDMAKLECYIGKWLTSKFFNGKLASQICPVVEIGNYEITDIFGKYMTKCGNGLDGGIVEIDNENQSLFSVINKLCMTNLGLIPRPPMADWPNKKASDIWTTITPYRNTFDRYLVDTVIAVRNEIMEYGSNASSERIWITLDVMFFHVCFLFMVVNEKYHLAHHDLAIRNLVYSSIPSEAEDEVIEYKWKGKKWYMDAKHPMIELIDWEYSTLLVNDSVTEANSKIDRLSKKRIVHKSQHDSRQEMAYFLTDVYADMKEIMNEVDLGVALASEMRSYFNEIADVDVLEKIYYGHQSPVCCLPILQDAVLPMAEYIPGGYFPRAYSKTKKNKKIITTWG